LRIRAYAKINLGLRVLRRREDGYHEIQGLMQTIGLADELVLERPSEGLELLVEPPLGVPSEENLAYRAAELLFKTVNLQPSLRLQLMKKTPAGAGLGGGSSDAAAVLAGLSRLLGLDLDEGRLAVLALELGSDVPFFLVGGTCLVGGRGGDIKRLPPLPEYHLVLLIPPFPLSTAAVYQKLDRLGEDEESLRLPGLLRNDLERAALALRPELVEYRNFLREQGADFFGLSGSGPAWFAGFRERGRAEWTAAEGAKLPGRAVLTGLIDHGYEFE